MAKRQFRVLYREFLFRMMDVELLSAQAQGDMSRLFGQFAALLLFVSSILALGALGFDSRRPIAYWIEEHFLVATTMLVVGLFAVLSWESTFPNRRDVLVLGPLPIRARTVFLARVAGIGTALGLTVAVLNACTGFTWPLAAAPVAGLIRAFAAYWITMLAAGAFIFCSVLALQGLAAQLPRRAFLRLSALLQMAAFCLFVSVYFGQPSLAEPGALTAERNQRLLAVLPSYWFFGLYHQLQGTMHPALAPLPVRAWIGLAVAVSAASVAFLLSYFRTLRRIVEEPDIVPGVRGANWLPRFGSETQTAIAQFSIRSLARSRQHRVLLAFYLGLGFAFLIGLMKPAFAGRYQLVSAPMLVASLLLMCLAVVGTRVVFSRPLELRANWVFRVTPVRAGAQCLAASRRSLLLLSVIPVWTASVVLFLWLWPWRQAAGHLLVLGLTGMILADVCLNGFQKLPFTCSYLPGKSRLHLTFLGAAALLYLIELGVLYERRALGDGWSYAKLIAVLCVAAVCARWRTRALARSSEAEPQFEDEEPPAVLALGISRDGAPLT